MNWKKKAVIDSWQNISWIILHIPDLQAENYVQLRKKLAGSTAAELSSQANSADDEHV